MIKLFLLALRFHLSAHYSTPVNFWSGVLGVFMNNLLFLGGMWIALFSGRPQNIEVFPIYLSITACVSGAWGLLLLLAGGLRQAPRWNEEGALDPFLAGPVHPLILIAISHSALPAIGDILQALVCLALIAFLGGAMALAMTLLVFPGVLLGFVGVLVLGAGVPFFLNRGASTGELLADSTLAASGYPLAQILDGENRWWLYLTPIAVTNLVPMAVIATHSRALLATLYAGSAVLYLISVKLFRVGIARYQSANFVGIFR